LVACSRDPLARLRPRALTRFGLRAARRVTGAAAGDELSVAVVRLRFDGERHDVVEREIVRRVAVALTRREASDEGKTFSRCAYCDKLRDTPT
jgi:hypothetical protein